MGSGSLANLQRHIPLEKVDAILLSHLHYDHIGDVFIFKYAVQQMLARKMLKQPPVLYLPGVPEDICQLAAGDGLLPAHIYAGGGRIRIGELDVSFHEMTHPVPSYAVEILCEGRRLVYSGDTTWNPYIEELAKDADLFLVDAGLLERHASPAAPHLSVQQACAVAAYAKKTVLTHISPFYNRCEILEEACQGALLAEEGQEYTI